MASGNALTESGSTPFISYCSGLSCMVAEPQREVPPRIRRDRRVFPVFAVGGDAVAVPHRRSMLLPVSRGSCHTGVTDVTGCSYFRRIGLRRCTSIRNIRHMRHASVSHARSLSAMASTMTRCQGHKRIGPGLGGETVRQANGKLNPLGKRNLRRRAEEFGDLRPKLKRSCHRRSR
jgi:hypothetical protein